MSDGLAVSDIDMVLSIRYVTFFNLIIYIIFVRNDDKVHI